MTKVGRRDVLKGLGALSAVALASQTACRDNDQTKTGAAAPPMAVPTMKDTTPCLNIVLHGMFAVELDSMQNKVHVLTPDIMDHSYCVAIADVDGATPPGIVWGYIRHINPRETLTLLNVQNGSFTSPNPNNPPTDRLVINWTKSDIDRRNPKTQPYCIFELPWPDEIWPLRGDTKSYLQGTTYNANGLALVQIPTIYVLSYHLPAGASDPVLAGGPDGPTNIPIGKDYVRRLHLFAESPFGGDPMNPNAALKVLCSMYVRHDKTALDIRIAPGSNSVPVPIADTRHSSVPKCEERSLGEMSITCGQLAAAVPAVQTSSSPRNCMSAIITMP